MNNLDNINWDLNPPELTAADRLDSERFWAAANALSCQECHSMVGFNNTPHGYWCATLKPGYWLQRLRALQCPSHAAFGEFCVGDR